MPGNDGQNPNEVRAQQAISTHDGRAFDIIEGIFFPTALGGIAAGLALMAWPEGGLVCIALVLMASAAAGAMASAMLRPREPPSATITAEQVAPLPGNRR